MLVALSAGADEDVPTLVAAARAARQRGLDVVAPLSALRPHAVGQQPLLGTA